MKILFSFLILLLSIVSYGQNIKSVRKKLISDLMPKANKHGWQLDKYSNQIKLTFIDTFYINTAISPLNNRNGCLNELDTFYIKVRLEDNWTQKKYDSIHHIQKAILDSLSKKFIAHYDSIAWKDMKSNKNMFLKYRYDYLLSWDGLCQTEKYQLNHFMRLPEKIIGTVGLFTDSNCLSCDLVIEPESVNIKVESAYQSFIEILGRAALYRCQDYY